jgi:hypothetical protein
MKLNNKRIKVAFRCSKAAYAPERVASAYDILFIEIYRLINDKPIMATK